MRELELKNKSQLNKLIFLLENYEKFTNDETKEQKIVKKIGQIFDSNTKLLETLGFKTKHNGDTIEDNEYSVHLTRGPNNLAYQFLVIKLHDGHKNRPDKVFMSFRYSEVTLIVFRSDFEILNEFVKYLRQKIHI